MSEFYHAITNENSTPDGIHFWQLKQYLYSVKDTEQSIKLLENRIEYREEEMECNNSVSAEDADKLDALRRQCEEKENLLGKQMIEVTDFIGQLESSSQQLVLTKRYIQHKTWEQIARELDMGVRLVQKLHGQALLALDKLMPEAA